MTTSTGFGERCREAFKWFTCTDTMTIPENPSAIAYVDYNEAKSWKTSFNALLTNLVGRRMFKEYLSSEHAQENIFFWELIEEYRRLNSADEMYEMAQEIYKRFVTSNSNCEINVDIKCRKALNKEIKNPTKNTFDEAQNQVYKLMERDSYQRFLRSNEYFTILVNSIPHDTILSWGKDFDALMSHEEGQRLFRDYLTTEKSDENIRFWQLVQNYKNLADHKQRQVSAAEIYRTYISPESKTEISIDGALRTEIGQRYKDAEKNLFEKAEKMIYQLMQRDCYPRFQTSAFFRSFVENHTVSETCFF